MPDNLCIRNFTSVPLTLHTVERLNPVPVRHNTRPGLVDLDCVKPGLCGLCSSHTDGDDAISPIICLPRTQDQIPVTKAMGKLRVEPFSLEQTLLSNDSNKGVHRLTFLDPEGNAFTCNLRTGLHQVADFVSKDDTAPTVVGLHLQHGMLAIFRNRDMRSWMRYQPDEMPLECLSIPGTHNSSTYHRALPSVRCQAVSLKEQMDNGVRFLDFRLQVDEAQNTNSDSLTLVHGNFPIAFSGSKKFRDLYNEVLDFLRRNPSETIVMSIKREGNGSGTDENLAQRLHGHYVNDKEWVTKPGVPLLGDARGRIVLLRRFRLTEQTKRLYSQAQGIDAQVWADNSHNSRAGDVHFQDCYEVPRKENIDQKIEYIRNHCERANSSVTSFPSRQQFRHSGTMFLNFLNASNFWHQNCWPEKIAARVNPEIARYLCEMQGGRGRGGIGVVICDWVGENGDWGLVKAIVALNESTAIT